MGCVCSSLTYLIPDVCSCHVSRILAVDVCRIWDVCCLPAPAHQLFSSNSSDHSAPEEAYSRNVRVSGTIKFGYEGVFKIETCCNSFSVHNTFSDYPVIYRE